MDEKAGISPGAGDVTDVNSKQCFELCLLVISSAAVRAFWSSLQTALWGTRLQVLFSAELHRAAAPGTQGGGSGHTGLSPPPSRS